MGVSWMENKIHINIETFHDKYYFNEFGSAAMIDVYIFQSSPETSLYSYF